MEKKIDCKCGAQYVQRQATNHLKSKTHATRLAGLTTPQATPNGPKYSEKNDNASEYERELKRAMHSSEDDADVVGLREKGAGAELDADAIERAGGFERDTSPRAAETQNVREAAPPWNEDQTPPGFMADGKELKRNAGDSSVLAYAFSTTPEGRKKRRDAVMATEQVADAIDLKIGDPRKKLQHVFEWCLDHDGFRYTFTRFYFDARVLVDRFEADSVAARREVGDKIAKLAEYNARVGPECAIGYLPLLASITTPKDEDVERALRHELVDTIITPEIRAMVGERIAPGRIIDVGTPFAELNEDFQVNLRGDRPAELATAAGGS